MGVFKLSLVVPVFNEEDNLHLFLDRCRTVLIEMGVDYEFIFIDDGSTDGSLALLTEAATADDRVKVLSLSRNFGSHASISAGLDHASGDAAVILAADLQDPPEVIPQFLSRHLDGFQAVWGVRKSRPEGAARQVANRLFYGLVRKAALPGYPKEGTGSFCLIGRKMIEVIRRFPEKQRITWGLVWWSGFKQTFVYYDRAPRAHGTSGWSKARLIQAAVDVLTTYSYVPLRCITYAGAACFILSLLGIGYVLLNWLIKEETMVGWASTMAGIFFFGGLQMIMLGVVGEYLWRIAVEVRSRPLYIVADKVNLPDQDADA